MRQLSNKVKQNTKANADSALGWDSMIRDARKRIEDLNYSIKVFERRKAAGEPWPGAQLADRSKEQQHSV